MRADIRNRASLSPAGDQVRRINTRRAGRHPNQKPLKLCLELVAKFTEPGELVLDPFAGSGRIGEACVLLGRRYLGLDNSEEWVEKARARLREAEKQVAEGRAPKAEECLRLCGWKKTA